MLQILAAMVVTVASSAIVGRAVWRLSGYQQTSPVAPAVGLAALFCLAAAAVALPGRAVTAGVVVTLATCAAALVPGLRADLRAAFRDGLPVTLVVGAAVCLPFAVSGRAGVLGVDDNNDMSFHMASVYWLQTHAGVPTEAAAHGYPFGAHSFVAGIGEVLRLSIPAAFTGLMLVVPILTAYAAFAALPGARRSLRVVAAILVGLPYLAASYLAQGAFKETLEALFILAFALAVREFARERRAARCAIPAGLLVAGMVSVYSYFGVAWPVATLVVLLAVHVLADGRRRPVRAARATIARAAPVTLAAAAALVVAAAGQADRIVAFADSSFAHEPKHGMGNLHEPINPLEALGVWPASDFRFHPPNWILTLALAALTGLALAGAVAWWLRRRDFVVPAALIGCLLVYWEGTIFKNPYNAAKALAIVSPLVALALAGALLGVRRARPALVGALAVVLAVPAAWSSFLALRDALVGPVTHENELASFRPVVAGQPTLFLGNDDFVWWELRGARVGAPRRLYSTWSVPVRSKKAYTPGTPFDFDSFTPRTLDLFRYVVAPRSPYASSKPPNFRLERRTASYELWKRLGPTPRRRILRERGAPGALLNCDLPRNRALTRRSGIAAVLALPVTAPWTAWSGAGDYAGGTASVALPLPAGAWDLSLQYVSREGVRVTAPGFSAELPANLERLGPYWPVGTIRVPRPGTVPIAVHVNELTAFGRALGARGRTRAFEAEIPLGGIAATRHGARPRLVPLHEACGRYVDWFRFRRGAI